MGSLRLTISPDDDGTFELHAEVSVNGFSGVGHAWFDEAQLRGFAMELEKYPLPNDSGIGLKGGFWSKIRKAELEQCHLSISLYPIDLKGTLGVRVHVSTPLHEQGRPQSQMSAQVELLTSYMKLEAFAEQIQSMVTRKSGEAILESI